MPGAMIRAMLAAYRRTLEKTMAQARSMDQVVDEAGLDWLETPDQAVVWGTALGLQKEIEARPRAEPRGRPRRAAPRPVSTYFPVWYGERRRRRRRGGSAGGGGGALLELRRCPDIGGMMSALGTIGNSPSSSGGGGGGFGGGGSGGGGGGAGGGF